ncbi:MAG: acyl carrier protein [Isosphaeraceae bacterium]|nr:acyl carrier protein [Isosphaeraceae bacterium]
MTDSMLLDTIEKAIREESESVRGLAINADSQLVEDLGLDSLDLVAIVLKLEDQLQIPIGVPEVRNFRTVFDLLAHVQRLQGTSAAA